MTPDRSPASVASRLLLSGPRRRAMNARAGVPSPDKLEDLNFDVSQIAERARRIDPASRMAHAVLARQLLIDGDADRAQAAWRNVREVGGAVVWTGTLYDVDARTYFLLTFGREGIR